jgi:hypothetical protein
MPILATQQPHCVPAIPARPLKAHLLALLIVLTGAPALCASSPTDSTAPPAEVQRSFQRRYQATAYITFLSVPIFSRSGVGFGFAGTDEHSGGEQQKLSLRFLSGSTPERAHGLNRFGFIQENVEQKDRTTISADYFGLMTASGEESLNDAKAALNSRTGGEVAFVAARAFVSREKTSYSVRNMLLPSSYRGSNADQLLKQVQAEFAPPQPNQIEKTESLNGQPTGTFLNCLRQAILAENQTYQSRIVFNGKTFQFQAVKRRDPRTGEELRKLGLTSSPHAIVQLIGTLRNEKTSETTNFRLWFEQGSPNFLPLRFEFKAKAYLRLVFDQEPPLPAQQLSLNRDPAQ